MNFIELIVSILERVEKIIFDFGEKYGRRRMDLLVSTLDFVGMRDQNLIKNSGYNVTDSNIEEIEEMEAIPPEIRAEN
jgi:hypothetical protein